METTWCPRPVLISLEFALLCLIATPSHAANLIVSNSTDVVNGDTASPEALVASPGPDGISLREAIGAANNAPGPHTITFDASLAGQTIVLTHAQGGFGVSRDGIAIVGIVDADGRPSITLDAGSVTPILFGVFASDFTLSRLRILHLAGSFGVWINAGVTGALPTPNEVRNITIEGNEFSNQGLGLTTAIPITIGTDASSTGATLLNVLVAHNTFTDFQADPSGFGGDGVHVHADGLNSLVRDVTISGNTFTNVTFGTEVVLNGGSSSRIEGTQIVGNTFTGNDGPVNLNQYGSSGSTSFGNIIDHTLIADNFIFGTLKTAIALIGGAGNTNHAAITNTQIINNVISGSADSPVSVGVELEGSSNGSMQGRVDGVAVVNNTIIGNVIGVYDAPDLDNGGGTVSGVTVLNSLFSANHADFQGENGQLSEPLLIEVSHCITNDPRFVGANGNFGADPLFINSANGDFHLKAGSPAIGKGSVAGAPCVDLDGLARLTDGKVDIGAYEFGAVFNPRPCPITAVIPYPPAPIKGRR